MELLCKILDSVKFIGHIDGTGGMIYIPWSVPGHTIFHSKLTFNPTQKKLYRDNYKFGTNINASFVLAEHVGSNQYGDDFAAFFLRMKNSYYELCSLTALPRLIKTDCGSGYQNGCITA